MNRRRLDEQISAYIDDELSASERGHLESQLASDPELGAELASLQRTVALVHELPQVEVPRNFLLPQSAVSHPRVRRAARARLAWAAPLLTAASSVVSVLFVIALAGSLLFRPGLGSLRAPAAAFEAAEEPAAQEGEVARTEIEVAVTLEVEAEAPVAAERAEPEAAPLVEEPAPIEAPVEETGPTWSPAEAAAEGAAPLEEAVSATPATDLSVPENAKAAEEVPEVQALEVAAEESGIAPTAPSATQTIRADEGEREMLAASPEATVVTGFAASTEERPRSGELDEGRGEPDYATGAPAPAEEEAEPEATVPVLETPLLPSDTSAPQLQPAERSRTPISWLGLQIGLGSAALILAGISIWAWRLRR